LLTAIRETLAGSRPAARVAVAMRSITARSRACTVSGEFHMIVSKDG
jgi:hypothetical protein